MVNLEGLKATWKAKERKERARSNICMWCVPLETVERMKPSSPSLRAPSVRCGTGRCGSCCRMGTWIFLSWAFLCSFISPLIYVVDTREDEVHFVTSKDGWRISLARYRAAGSVVGSRKQSTTAPVILCHGAFANRMTYDLGAARCRARENRGRASKDGKRAHAGALAATLRRMLRTDLLLSRF